MDGGVDLIKDIPESPTDVYFTSDTGGILKQYYSKFLMGSLCVPVCTNEASAIIRRLKRYV